MFPESLQSDEKNAWLNLEKQREEPVFDANESIDLSASAIKTYMECPRQFYYRHILRLPQQDNISATLGSLTHRLMAIFNSTVEAYSSMRLQSLMTVMLNFETDQGAFFKAGFTIVDLEKLKALPPLELTAFQNHLSVTIQDLSKKGYFDRYANPQAIAAEKSFKQIQLPGLNGCTFSCQIDALIQDNQGQWDLIDYKTSQSAYTTGLDTCDRHFEEILASLPQGETQDHTTRFDQRLQSNYPKEYQLFLYYLACMTDPIYQGKIHRLAWQLLRPEFPEAPHQGSIQLGINTNKVEARKEQLLNDIQDYIVDPIRGVTNFKANPKTLTCQRCDYRFICDANQSENEVMSD